jgi:hypothetical protein
MPPSCGTTAGDDPNRIHGVGIQRKGAKPPGHKVKKSKFTSAGPEIAFTKPSFSKHEPSVFKTFAPSRLCAFALKIFRRNPA